MTSWHKHSSSLRHERSGRKWPQSERRWKKEQLSQQCKADYQQNGGLRGGMLVLFAERASQNGRWQDSIREQVWQIIWPTIKILSTIGWVHQFWKETLKGKFFGYVLRAALWGISLDWHIIHICSVQCLSTVFFSQHQSFARARRQHPCFCMAQATLKRDICCTSVRLTLLYVFQALMITDHEDLQGSEASEIYVKRFNSQELFAKGEYECPCAYRFFFEDFLIVQ